MQANRTLRAAASGLVLLLSLSGAGRHGAGQTATGTEPVVASSQPVTEQQPALERSIFPAEEEFDPHWEPVGVYTNAAACATCHTASRDGSGVMRLPQSAEGKDISPPAGWRHSMMAHAWNDPYFQATVEDQANEFPDYAGDIEDKCLTCHAPMGHSQAHASGLGLSNTACTGEAACYRMATAQQDDHAREGVSCTLCHQMVDGDIGMPASGNFLVPGEEDAAARIIYGPFLNPRARPMQRRTNYTVQHSAYLSSSQHCATCHDLSTTTFDINTGHPAQPAISFKEQAPYAEWRNSRYSSAGLDGKSCQDCHMPAPDNYATRIAVTPSGVPNNRWPERQPYSLHGLAGGNTYVLGLLKIWRRDLGIADSTSEEGFDAAISRSREVLRQAADISLQSHSRNQEQLKLGVTVKNRTGHKLPTGYPSRRMWVQLTVADDNGRIFFDSGKPNEHGLLDMDQRHVHPSCLTTNKPAGFDSTSCFEQHRNQISSPEQVAIYESVMADTNRNITYTLLYAASYLKDNRIPPQGFSSNSGNYDETTAVVGDALADKDFNSSGGRQGSGQDTIHFEITLPDQLRGELSVQARLWYQSIRPAFIDAYSHGGQKALRMQSMYRDHPPLPELLGTDTLTIR